MKFYFDATADPAVVAEHTERYSDCTLACSFCMSEDTVEVDELVPSGFHHKVKCANGHVTNGIPPERFCNDAL